MMWYEKMERVIDGLRYSTETATLIAHNSYWDGSNFERNGRNTFLFRTPRGRYFVVELSQWQDERDTLVPVSEDEAAWLYEHVLPEHLVEWENAFPEREVEEA